jgi:uncharacterized repeat protein (TIGR01451 family)
MAGTDPSGQLVSTATVHAAQADNDYSSNLAVYTTTLTTSEPAPAETEGAEAAGLFTSTSNLLVVSSAPTTVIAGLPFTYVYTITNAGTADVTNVRFENAVPPATILNGYAPGIAPCSWREGTVTCFMRDLATGETITITLVASGHSGQQLLMWLDPLMPGWPMCYLLKERDYLHIVTCELGGLRAGQSTRVRVGFTAMGVQERIMGNMATVRALGTAMNSVTNSNVTTITVLTRADVGVWAEPEGHVTEIGVFSYTLTANNYGPSDAANVLLTDTLPAGTNLVSIDPGLGVDCTIVPSGLDSTTLGCRVGRLISGEAFTVTISVVLDRLLPLDPGDSITHTARITADQIDPNASNNEIAEFITVGSSSED